MQDAVKGQQAGATEKKKDGRNTPIGTDPSLDSGGDPPPKPPYGGPEGDGDQEQR